MHIKGIPGEIALSTDEHIAAWQKLQYGMFIHWGLYSELGGEYKGKPQKEGYSEQIQMWANIPDEEYKQIAERFSAEKYDPKEICALAKKAGMKYIVITTKHHDGFSLFDTKTTDYNIVQATPFQKDAIKMLADECRKQGLKFGMYYSLVDWHQGHKFDHHNNNPIPDSIEKIIEEQLHELLTNYGPIAEVWFDMSSPTVEQSKKFTDIVRKLQPKAAINGRIWNNQGDFRTLGDNQVPDITLEGPWQTPASIYRETWGYRRWQVRDDFMGKVRDLTTALIRIVARGGNYLLNIGPRGDGSIVSFEAKVLEEIGKWLDRHPKAVLGSRATKFPEQSWGEVTVHGKNLYLHIIDWPTEGEITLEGLATPVEHVESLSTNKECSWTYHENQLTVTLPDESFDSIVSVLKVRLEDSLHILPQNMVYKKEDGCWEFEADDLSRGYNYADEGHYFSLKQTVLRKTAYLMNREKASVMVMINGSANEQKKYRLQVGSAEKIFSGKELTNQKIGPFKLSEENAVIPIELTLAEKEHANEDLDLTFKTMMVEQV